MISILQRSHYTLDRHHWTSTCNLRPLPAEVLVRPRVTPEAFVEAMLGPVEA